MKKREIIELKSKPTAELLKLASEYREKIRGLLFDKNAGKLQNGKAVRKEKQNLARVLTFIRAAENSKQNEN